MSDELPRCPRCGVCMIEVFFSNSHTTFRCFECDSKLIKKGESTHEQKQTNE